MTGNLNFLTFDWGADVSNAERDRLFDSVVGIIRKRRLEVPAALFLEISAPLGHVAGQGLIVFAPFIAPWLPGGVGALQKVSKLLERPENVRLLIDRLSEPAEPTEDHAAR
jgi:hypothetical protein